MRTWNEIADRVDEKKEPATGSDVENEEEIEDFDESDAEIIGDIPLANENDY
jgi:hypothetical protein